jgi:hypothetical protein
MSNECDRSPTYPSYMLRLWQAGGRDGRPVWRASLENLHTGERLAFGATQALFAGLADLMASAGEIKVPLERTSSLVSMPASNRLCPADFRPGRQPTNAQVH